MMKDLADGGANEAVGKGTTKIMYEGEDIKSGQDIVKTITVVVK